MLIPGGLIVEGADDASLRLFRRSQRRLRGLRPHRASARRPSFLETGAVSPDIIARARGTRQVAGGAFVGSRACGPAIDDAGALRGFMAARAATVRGPGGACEARLPTNAMTKNKFLTIPSMIGGAGCQEAPAIRSPTERSFASSISQYADGPAFRRAKPKNSTPCPACNDRQKPAERICERDA